MLLIQTDRLSIDEAKEDDINEIMAIETHPDNRSYIWSGTFEEHRDEIMDPCRLLLIFRETITGATKGFALICLDHKSHIFEIRRIAITDKSKGYGKEAMRALIRYAFEKTETNRLWLDVFPDNTRGIQLYDSLGMHRDGILRQNYLSERGYLDQIIYSLLRSEYKQDQGLPPGI